MATLDGALVEWLDRSVLVRVPPIVGKLRDHFVQVRYGGVRYVSTIGKYRPVDVLGAAGCRERSVVRVERLNVHVAVPGANAVEVLKQHTDNCCRSRGVGMNEVPFHVRV